MAKYTTVNIMKINACRATIKMWKIDQPAPRIAPKIVPEIPVAAHIPSNKKITSPAYILPKSRNECESGFETYSIKLNRKLRGSTQNLVPVSYTHLDVYKRQVPISVSICGTSPKPVIWDLTFAPTRFIKA